MRVEVFPSDKTGCGHYRMAWPAMALNAVGHDVRVRPGRPQIIVQGGHVVGYGEANPPDVMIFQRPCKKAYIELFEVLQRQGVRIVVDMDDDLSNIHYLNQARMYYDGHMDKTAHWRFGEEACRMADWVTVSAPALAERYAPHGRASVLSNCIPEAFLSVEAPRSDLVTVGWAGTLGTHPRDLQVTEGAVAEGLAGLEDESRFLAIGEKSSKLLAALNIPAKKPHAWQNGVEFKLYPAAIAQFHIGIVPLEDTVFNKSKSWLKALEYGAVGVAPIVSPTPENLRVVEAGAALCAATPSEWREHVRRLIQSPEEIKDLAGRAKEFASNWTFEKNIDKWAAAWLAI